MKITFDGQLLLGRDRTGIAWNAHNLILELLKYHEHEYTIQCFRGRRNTVQISRLVEYQRSGCRIEYCRRFYYTIYKILWIVLPVPHRFFFRTKADVTQFFNYAVPPGVRGKRVTYIYDMAYKACPYAVSRKTRIWLELCMRKSCRHADHIITISEFSKKEILKYLKVPEENITVVPCAVNHTVYHPNYSQTQIRKILDRYEISQEYFLYLGTIEPRKNLERLIAAYAMLCKEKQHVPLLVLAGKKGWLCEGIYAKVRKLGMEKKILFPGYIPPEESPLLMCGARAFLFPSLYEGFGMPLLEAMACGTPVIASNTTSLPEVAGDAGILINPESEKEICRAMKKILEDEQERKRLQECGIERARSYTWKKSTAMLLDVYQMISKTKLS